jgi:LPPG:FO 2-phospho-L-lactate transferase
MTALRRPGSVVALSGGVGGARLLHGLARALPDGALTAIVNTGDDFEHWGLHIAPDLDTVMYTLADLANEERGWGLADESFEALAMVRRYGGDDWFALGDRDLATHLLRTQALRSGEPLTAVTARLCGALGVRTRVLPMADHLCPTLLDTVDHGTLPFQQWFVRRRAPPVRAVRFDGAPTTSPSVLAALAEAELSVIGPSNPYVSIDPILRLDGVREAMARRKVVALSPLVGGQAVKGPLGEMIPLLAGEPPSTAAIVRHYRGLLAGIVVERGDDVGIDPLPSLATATVMRSRADSRRLAEELLAFAESLR